MMKKLLFLLLLPVVSLAQVPFRAGIQVDSLFKYSTGASTINIYDSLTVNDQVFINSSVLPAITLGSPSNWGAMRIYADDGYYDIIPSPYPGTNRTDTLLALHSGTIPVFANTYSTLTYEGNVTPAIVDLFSASGLTADSTASASNTTTAGIYRISVYTDWSADNADGSTLDVTVTWENSASVSTNATTTEISTTGTKYATNTYTVYHDGTTAITYAADITRSGTTDAYALRVVVERLN